MSDIVRLYQKNYAPTVGGGSTPGNEFLEDPLLQHIYKRRHVENESELDQYLKAPRALPTTDILQWWKVDFSFTSNLSFLFPLFFY